MNRETQEKINSIVCSLLVVIGVYAIGAYFFDFYYDLNDDMVIKDILSGAYSGTPEGHTNQILYPLGVILACTYRLLPQAPVFGFFLCACFCLCFGLIVYRMESFFQNKIVKITTVIIMILVFLSLLLWEIIYVQYSVVCGILIGTACFWFCSFSTKSTVGDFWKQNIPTLLLVWLAFLIRSEMMLLTTPFLAAVGMLHWLEAAKIVKENYNGIERKKNWQHFFSKVNLWKYPAFLLVLVLGMGMALGTDILAHGGQEWKEYRSFFDARTKLYDYTWYPNYEEQQAFYEEKEISEIQYRLIDNYNFGLDESITDHTLETIASYGEKPRMLGNPVSRMKNSFVELLHRNFLPSDAPYNYFVMAGYVLVIGLAVIQRKKEYIGKLMLVFLAKCVPWMYLLYVQRAVNRITHPLYIIEFMILLAMLAKELYDRPLWNVEKYYRMVAAGVLALIAALYLPFGISHVKTEQNRREEVSKNQILFDNYAKAHPENYYYLDVYSTVSFVEKMFENVDNSRKNYDLMGGWYHKSPVQKETMERYTGTTNMEEALLTDQVCFVMEQQGDATFIEDYYKTKNKKVVLELQDTVGEGENPFLVYKIVEKSKK
ncbi:MAG: hypothetical protein IKW30_10300 [Lachnospiraceae bacterium]|nr:hypothetical protein [Lachnospiraceae bacterium]